MPLNTAGWIAAGVGLGSVAVFVLTGRWRKTSADALDGRLHLGLSSILISF